MIQQFNFSSVRGKIKFLLMAFNSTKVEKPMGRMLAMLRLMPSVKFLLWCSRPDVCEAVCQFLAQNKVTYTAGKYDVNHLPDHLECIVVYENFSNVDTWIRDAFFPATLANGHCMLLDTIDESGKGQGWAKRMEQMNLASGTKFKVIGVSDVQVESSAIAGGDMLVDGRWVFLGKKRPLLERLMGEQFGPNVEIVVLHEKEPYPLLYHIDLFLTLTGIVENEQYVVLLGQCVALTTAMEEVARQQNVCLDKIASRLQKDYGIKVVRNPLPLGQHLYVYNNCLIEVTSESKTVWLPAYSTDHPEHDALKALEKENETIWRELGFNPCLVSAPFGDLLGVKAGLHCITNEVRSYSLEDFFDNKRSKIWYTHS